MTQSNSGGRACCSAREQRGRSCSAQGHSTCLSCPACPTVNSSTHKQEGCYVAAALLLLQPPAHLEQRRHEELRKPVQRSLQVCGSHLKVVVGELLRGHSQQMLAKQHSDRDSEGQAKRCGMRLRVGCTFRENKAGLDAALHIALDSYCAISTRHYAGHCTRPAQVSWCCSALAPRSCHKRPTTSNKTTSL